MSLIAMLFFSSHFERPRHFLYRVFPVEGLGSLKILLYQSVD